MWKWLDHIAPSTEVVKLVANSAASSSSNVPTIAEEPAQGDAPKLVKPKQWWSSYNRQRHFTDWRAARDEYYQVGQYYRNIYYDPVNFG